MEPGATPQSPLSDCREPKHRELFLAVIDATKGRSGTRHRQAEQSDELQALFKRQMPALKGNDR